MVGYDASRARAARASKRHPPRARSPEARTILELLGDLGDFVGGIAVVATLAYLALELRHTREVARANGVRELTESLVDMNRMLIDAEHTDIYLRGSRNYSALEREEKLRFGLIIGMVLARLNSALEFRERGLVDDEFVDMNTAVIKLMFQQPGVQQWRVGSSGQYECFSARVRAWVDRNCAPAGATDAAAASALGGES